VGNCCQITFFCVGARERYSLAGTQLRCRSGVALVLVRDINLNLSLVRGQTYL
jgi:hypothetical protein